MKIRVPDLSVVLLMGASGSGKSTFARTHFLSTEILSSDWCRSAVCDDENSLEATNDAFELLHKILDIRLRRGKLCVIDATNVHAHARASILKVAKQNDVPVVAIAFALPERICQDRNGLRPDRNFGPHVIRNHTRDLRSSLRTVQREGIRDLYVLNSEEDVNAAIVERHRAWPDKSHLQGPFDVIGDVHGCREELIELLETLGYEFTKLDTPVPTTLQESPGREDGAWKSFVSTFLISHPSGRKAVFLGDLVDRGPDSVGVLEIVMSMVASGSALAVPGNHDEKLIKHFMGKKVSPNHGTAETIAQMEGLPQDLQKLYFEFLKCLVSHLVLDEGKLVVAHAGMKEQYIGRASGRIREFALYGETTGESDEFGLPVRYPWAKDYRGKATIVYGHTPVLEPEWLNNTICLDTGCAFGGKLTALRWPEREIVSVPAKRVYVEPVRPLAGSTLSLQHESDETLDIRDFMGRMYIDTRLMKRLTIREENTSAALEIMSRFAANPKWIVHLPPTMSPVKTSAQEDYLERPEEAFSYFMEEGVDSVVLEEKHMGSRAIFVVCKDPEVVRNRFGIDSGETGAILTRTGRRFFADIQTEQAILGRVVSAAHQAGLWEKWESDWVVLDAELMPWSAKARELIVQQYAPVAAAGAASVSEAVRKAKSSAAAELLGRFEHQLDSIRKYQQSYRRYCWEVNDVSDYRIAPFHVLATEGKVWHEVPHKEHLANLNLLCSTEEPILQTTNARFVSLLDDFQVKEAVQWWEQLTEAGGEGMVVKPAAYTVRGSKGLVQPALKVRGREYLRIIYGPEYTHPSNLQRLKTRSLAAKRALALREFSLGIEALERFVEKQPLRRVHECVFGVLALESERVDPRL